ncbi:hypothetical protein AXF42_Ash014325 [Apostasia shenzhenica]|uniref:Uncharacterized protein n=1 Tax=Apostasia shenzhenica TaxID=1088818 RepID=A0A2I0B0U1_9ASPA|nr:hypothetical protein AXF42_Ash014325 [Apostasia shenzhenica]
MGCATRWTAGRGSAGSRRTGPLGSSATATPAGRNTISATTSASFPALFPTVAYIPPALEVRQLRRRLPFLLLQTITLFSTPALGASVAGENAIELRLSSTGATAAKDTATFSMSPASLATKNAPLVRIA